MFKQKPKVKDPGSLEHAHQYALFLLNLRLRTVKELEDKMKERGYEPTVIQKEISTLKSLKYVDDERYAEVMTDNLKKYKQYGYYKVKTKLVLKKLKNELIEKVLGELFTEKDELQVAKRFLKNQEGIKSLSYPQKQKLAMQMKNRGFRQSVISKLIF